MDYPVCLLNACPYKEIPLNTIVLNKYAIDSYIWIHVPTEISKEFSLYQINEIVPDNIECTFLNSIEQECNRPWFKISTENMNLSSGQHVYKMSFVSVITNDICSIYFSYIIQDDNPDKPYIYMKRD